MQPDMNKGTEAHAPGRQNPDLINKSTRYSDTFQLFLICMHEDKRKLLVYSNTVIQTI